MSQQTKKISTVLSNDSSMLGQLISKAKAVAELDTKIQNSLPTELKGRYKVAGYEMGVLTFLTDNGATATQIRYATPELTRLLRKDPKWAGLVNIKVKVHLHWHEFAAPKKEAPKPLPQDPISEQSKESIQALVNSLSDDPKNNEIVRILQKLLNSGER